MGVGGLEKEREGDREREMDVRMRKGCYEFSLLELSRHKSII